MKTARKNLPDDLLDEDGYPTEEWLQFLRTYVPDESLPIMAFVERALPDGWWCSDWGYKLHEEKDGRRELELHTGGWSGNEEVVDAILHNEQIREGMRHFRWMEGGHYYFEIKTKPPKTEIPYIRTPPVPVQIPEYTPKSIYELEPHNEAAIRIIDDIRMMTTVQAVRDLMNQAEAYVRELNPGYAELHTKLQELKSPKLGGGHVFTAAALRKVAIELKAWKRDIKGIK